MTEEASTGYGATRSHPQGSCKHAPAPGFEAPRGAPRTLEKGREIWGAWQDRHNPMGQGCHLWMSPKSDLSLAASHWDQPNPERLEQKEHKSLKTKLQGGLNEHPGVLLTEPISILRVILNV